MRYLDIHLDGEGIPDGACIVFASTARAAMSRLQQFGVIFGYRYVVIYAEPNDNDEGRLTTNTSRTALLLHNEPLPWAEWAAEFRDNLPKPIARLVEEKAAAAANTDHQKSIRDRLKDILELFQLSRYRPFPGGDLAIDDKTLVRGGVVGNQTRGHRSGTESMGLTRPGGTAGNAYAIFEKWLVFQPNESSQIHSPQ